MFDILFGRLEPRCTAAGITGIHSAGELGQLRRQVGIRDRGIGQLAAAVDDRPLDAVEARWDTLKDQVPQILDARRVLLLSTAEILAMADEEE